MNLQSTRMGYEIIGYEITIYVYVYIYTTKIKKKNTLESN